MLGLFGVVGGVTTGLLLLLLDELVFLPDEEVWEELPPEITLSPTFAEDTLLEMDTLEFGVSIETFSAETCTFSTEPLPVIIVSFAVSVIVTFLMVPSVCKFAFAATFTFSTFPRTVSSTGEETVTLLKVPSKMEVVFTSVVSTVLPCVKILTGADFFSTERPFTLELCNFTVWIPPPRTISVPLTVTLFNSTSPSPIPSAKIKSLSMTLFSNLTSGVLIITSFPSLELSSSGAIVSSVIKSSMESSNKVATCAREIGSSGRNSLSKKSLLRYPF